jgi:hypothetical protein
MRGVFKAVDNCYFAFALNEFRYRRVHFTKHKTKEAAEKSAYRLSGQDRRRRRRDFNGAESANDDLYPHVLNGKAALDSWAKECNYKIDFKEMVMIYVG